MQFTVREITEDRAYLTSEDGIKGSMDRAKLGEDITVGDTVEGEWGDEHESVRIEDLTEEQLRHYRPDLFGGTNQEKTEDKVRVLKAVHNGYVSAETSPKKGSKESVLKAIRIARGSAY